MKKIKEIEAELKSNHELLELMKVAINCDAEAVLEAVKFLKSRR